MMMCDTCLTADTHPHATVHHTTLSLHDALPISGPPVPTNIRGRAGRSTARRGCAAPDPESRAPSQAPGHPKLIRQPLRVQRSEEHTSELQSHVNLVCRLLLEKKKQHALTPHTHH